MTLPSRSPSVEKRSAVARLTPRSIFSYWRLTWRRLTAVFGPPLLVLIVGIVANQGTAKIASTRADGRRSRAVTDAADQLVAILTDAETGQRGYLLTQNDAYLRPYFRAVDSISVATARLRSTVASIGPSPEMQRDVDSLALLSQEKMEEIAETIRLRRDVGAGAALALVKTNRGLDLMHDARRIAASVRDHEAGRLAARSAELTRYTNEVTWIVILGTGAAFLIALLVNVLLAREAAIQTRLAAERDDALGSVTDSNSQLARASQGLSVLAEASAALATSIDTDETIGIVAQLAVPRLGDWCTIELLQPDGSLKRLATVHSDPEKLAIAAEFYRRFPPTPDEPGGVYTVLRTGQLFSSEITDAMIIAGVEDLEKRALLLALHLRSYVIAPLMVDGAPAGAITVVSAESGHFLGPSDIARVQELARRTALAIERSRRFAETVSARDAESVSNARLRESEAKLVLSMEAGGLGSWEWDIKRNRVIWSPQTERMHGLAEGTFSGTREEFASYIHPDDRERVDSEIARTLAARLPTYHIKYRFIRKDGAVRWLEGFARLRTDERGEPDTFLGVSHDVTEREELLVGERQARRDAEAANAAKAIFLTTMSHELRTPLNAVSGYVDLLEMGVRGPVTDLQSKDLKRIRRASQHLLVLINDILNYARLEAGTVELHLTEVALDDALSGMEALIAPQLQTKGVAYEYRKCDTALRVRADREKLDQILLNLVGNAVKFTDGGGRITLSCDASDGSARVIVADTGRGIPRGKHRSIFDPFVQVDRHLTPERQQGVGLGLAISRDLARAMHGDISVQSDAGKGATFVLTLPLLTAGEQSRISGEVERVL